MIELGVNIDHVATLRNVRGTAYPSPLRAAQEAEDAGADVITLHLREDRRHIRDADVHALKPLLRTRMNLECAVTPEMLSIACEVRPSDVCLVPERRAELTTEGGLDLQSHGEAVGRAIAQLAACGIRVSLFIDPEPSAVQLAHALGAPVVELHTGRYAECVSDPNQHLVGEGAEQLTRIRAAAEMGCALGLRVNAGHGLHPGNLQAIAALPTISELNIGHAIVAESVFTGWQATVRHFKALMVQARASA